jgi:cytochrome c biogenesis protein CcdA
MKALASGPEAILIIGFVVAVALELAFLPLVLAEQAEEVREQVVEQATYQTTYTVEKYNVTPTTANGGPCGDGTFGYGITFGPREARQGLVWWPCAVPILEATQYGEPETDLHMKGPVVDQAAVEVPEPVAEWLLAMVSP